MNFLLVAMNRTGHRYICAWIIENLFGTVALHRNCVNGWNEDEMRPDKAIVTKNSGEGFHTVKTIEEIHLIRLDLLINLRYYKEAKFVIVVRSPRNWLASCLRGGGHFIRNMTKAREEIKDDYWVLYPFSRLDAYKSYFFSEIPENTVVINYDKFVTSNSYKNKIRKQLGLENITNEIENDINQKKNSIYGYSSFNDESYTERYLQLCDRKTKMLNDLMDDEMLEIERKFF